MNKIKFLMTIIALFVAGCSTNQGFEGYRYNPFQFPYPEYYMKAELIPISDGKSMPENNMVKLDFFGFSSNVPVELFDAKPKEVKENKVVYKTDDKVLIIHREKDNLLGCADEQVKDRNKDFCSAFESTKEYYDKLYTLTPDELKKNANLQTGNKWIVHKKGFTFENVDTLRKYVGKDFVAYESSYKTGSKMTNDMILFLEKGHPYYFTFATNITDVLFFKKLLEAFQD